MSTSSASATTPSSSRWRISSAIASSAASRISSTRAAARRSRDDDLLAALGVVGERLREREAVGVRLVQRLEHVVRDARADHLQQHGRRHRQAEPQDRLVGLVDRVAVLERVHQHARHPRQHAVDDERRARPRRARRACAASLADVPGGRERRVVGLGRRGSARRAAARATGLKKCMPTTARVLELGAISVTDSDEVFVASTHSGETTARSSAKTCCLTLQLLEDGLEHEVAVGEPLVAGRAGDERGEEARLALVVAALRDLLRELASIDSSARVDDLLARRRAARPAPRAGAGTASRAASPSGPAPTMPTF